MTKLMEQAIRRLQEVPEDRQDQVAGFVIDELEQDEEWIASTSAHERTLGRLVADVLDADRRGECETLDPDRL